MLEAMGDHEHYCASYSSKDQPHIDGLLHTLSDGVRFKELDLAIAREEGTDVTVHEQARQMLQRLVSATNRRMHKGFPEIHTRNDRKPMTYSSHMFVLLNVDPLFRAALATLYRFCAAPSLETHPQSEVQEADAVADGDELSLRFASRVALHPCDYNFRPAIFERCPLCFFMSGFVADRRIGEHTFRWVELPPQDINGTPLRQRSYSPKPVMSSTFPDLPLLTSAKGLIFRYDFYPRLRTGEPWRVPELRGRLPLKPDDSSTCNEKGQFALMVMLLFRPYRRLQDLFESCLGAPLRTSKGLDDATWQCIYNEFCRWRSTEVDQVADPYFSRTRAHGLPRPAFNSVEWWACMISEKIRNFELATRRVSADTLRTPTDLSLLPEDEPVSMGGMERPHDDCDDRASDVSGGEASCGSAAELDGEDFVDSERVSGKPQKAPTLRRDSAAPVLCGTMPAGLTLESFHDPPMIRGRKPRSKVCPWICRHFKGRRGRLFCLRAPTRRLHGMWNQCRGCTHGLTAAEAVLPMCGSLQCRPRYHGTCPPNAGQIG